ncbi:MAG: hypothetical protein V4773_11635 [Verrucomicrobiota bacterium]
MHLPIPHFPPDSNPTHSFVVSSVREDVLWDRPVFKAPPLEPLLRGFNAAAFVNELPRVNLANR